MEIKYGTFFKWSNTGCNAHTASAGLCMVTYGGAVSLCKPNSTWNLCNPISWFTEQVEKGNVVLVEGALMFCPEDGLFTIPVAEV